MTAPDPRYDLVGLRDADLSADERALRDASIAADATAAADADLAARLGALPPEVPGGPSLADILARAEQTPVTAAVPETLEPANRPGPLRWLGGLAVAAAAVVAVAVSVGGEADEGRWKGTGGEASLRLEVVAEHPGGLRSLGDDGAVRSDERVLFTVHADRPGHLALYEAIDDRWALVTDFGEVAAGRHVPGGERPLSWRPDRVGDQARYRAIWCPAGVGGADGAVVPAGCSVVEESLRWAR